MVKTSVKVEGRTKAISNGCNAGPASLHEIESEIDRVSGSKKWVGKDAIH